MSTNLIQHLTAWLSQRINETWKNCTEEDAALCRGQFRGTVDAMNEEIIRLRRALERCKEADATPVIQTIADDALKHTEIKVSQCGGESWEADQRQDSFEKWFAYFEGCAHCDCSHGCRQWLHANSTKAIRLLRIMSDSDMPPRDEMDNVVKKHTSEVDREWFEGLLRASEARRAKAIENAKEQK